MIAVHTNNPNPPIPSAGVCQRCQPTRLPGFRRPGGPRSGGVVLSVAIDAMVMASMSIETQQSQHRSWVIPRPLPSIRRPWRSIPSLGLCPENELPDRVSTFLLIQTCERNEL